jgi:hypothetical protein
MAGTGGLLCKLSKSSSIVRWRRLANREAYDDHAIQNGISSGSCDRSLRSFFPRGEGSSRRLALADDNEAWDYERGRLWAVLAPLDMPLFIGKRVNKKALAIFRIANGVI